MPNLPSSFPSWQSFLKEYSIALLHLFMSTSQPATNWMLSYRATAPPGSPKTSSCHNHWLHFLNQLFILE